MNLKKTCIIALFFTQLTMYGQRFTEEKIQLNNPWLCLKAIQKGYPDIVEDFFFDNEKQDWCIKVRNTNLYWANGRLLKDEDAENWQNWCPFINYYYSNKTAEPKFYTQETINSLKTKNIIKNRKNKLNVNYSFNKIVYQGDSKQKIVRNLREIFFLEKKIWVHKRIVEPLKSVEKKILTQSKTDKETKIFLKNIANCWGFNWRVIKDSGKISNHSWGIAVDITPKQQWRKKIYWLWEAYQNEYWMMVDPKKKWSPPITVIEAFQSEGFIWGGYWDVWDNMHFEYRPEMLYINKFISKKEDLTNKKIKPNMNIQKQEFKPKGIVKYIFGLLYPIQEYSENFQNSKLDGCDFFKNEIYNEKKAKQTHKATGKDILIP